MKIFISHSSKDKIRYVDKVVKKLIEKLGENSVVYDSLTFEAGEKSIDEINRTLAITDLYVILLSETALDSNWVKYELSKANKKFNEKQLNRIFPLIIESTLKYSDDKIPDWLRAYNLKYIVRPAKAAKLIIERAKDIGWKLHPNSLYKNNIFVGRNELVNEFEMRIDDFNKVPLNTFIVSGIPKMGRQSLARHCFIKGSIIQQDYEFPLFSLNYKESIEDFLIKINDFGFNEGDEIVNLSNITLDEKIKYSIKILKEISQLSEIILIKDDGCIIDYRGNISNWFKSIILSAELSSKIIFVVITKYKINYETIRDIECASFINVPELNQFERKGLLRRLADMNNLDLNRNELDEIGKHLSGYPEQIYYAIELIKNKGYPYLKRNFELLAGYNEQEVSSLLEKYKTTPEVFEILALIGKYDAISISMLYDVLSETPPYIDIYESLFQESFFELEGVNGEYVRLNEVIRSYISRSGAKIVSKHIKKSQQLFKEMFLNENSSWYNSNDFLLAIRENIKANKDIPKDYMIPSVYLKSMSDLYADMKYENVVKLANIALDNASNTDQKILYEIRYLLCSALAKLKKEKCLEEIQKISDNEDKLFLQAFYYRQIGKNNYALEKLDTLLAKKPDFSKAKREKVLVLKNLQQFEDAKDLAKENYYFYSDNPYHIQAYFDCLINTYYKVPEDELLKNLLDKMNKIQSEKARSMYGRCLALYEAYVNQDYETAIIDIDKTIEDFPKDEKYALIVKFDIARLFYKIDIMENVIKELEKEGANINTVVICKSKFYAAQGKTEKAITYFSKNILFFTKESKEAFCEKLSLHHTKDTIN